MLASQLNRSIIVCALLGASLLSACGDQSASAATLGANAAAAPATLIQPRARIVGEWDVSVTRSREHAPAELRPLLGMLAGHMHMSITPTTLTLAMGARPPQAGAYSVTEETADSLTISEVNGAATSVSDVVFEGNDVVSIVARSNHQGFTFVRTGSAVAVADSADPAPTSVSVPPGLLGVWQDQSSASHRLAFDAANRFRSVSDGHEIPGEFRVTQVHGDTMDVRTKVADLPWSTGSSSQVQLVDPTHLRVTSMSDHVTETYVRAP